MTDQICTQNKAKCEIIKHQCKINTQTHKIATQCLYGKRVRKNKIEVKRITVDACGGGYAEKQGSKGMWKGLPAGPEITPKITYAKQAVWQHRALAVVTWLLCFSLRFSVTQGFCKITKCVKTLGVLLLSYILLVLGDPGIGSVTSAVPLDLKWQNYYNAQSSSWKLRLLIQVR